MPDSWATAWMRLRVDPRQVKDDVDKGLAGAKGDEAGKRVGTEFGDAFSGQFRSQVRGERGRFVRESGDMGKDAGTESGRSFGQSFTALAAGMARSFWQGYRQSGTPHAQAAGHDHGTAYATAFSGQVKRMFSALSRDTDKELSLTARHIGGFSPGILGISPATRGSLIGGGIAAGLGALPTLAAGGAAAGVLGGGGILAAAGAKALIGTKNTKADPNAQGPLYDQAQAISKQFQDTMRQAAAGMLPPLKAAFGQIPGMLKSIAPELKAAFAGAGTLIGPLLQGVTTLAKDVLPLLGQAFRAVAPLVKPLLAGLDGLLKGLLPGVITLLKAAAPAVQVLAAFLAQLGKAAGSMLAAFAPAIKASAVVFKALGDVIAALFPVIGQLAQIFATALAPVLTQLGAAIRALMPFLTLAGKAIADLAGVMFGVLAVGLKAVVQLLQAIAPALTAFAGMLVQIFTVLENKNIFQMLATAIESVIPEIATLVNALLGGLMPLLPPVISFMTQLAAMVAGALGNALRAVLPLLTHLATVVLTAIAKILPVILPPLLSLVNTLGSALGRALALVLPVLARVAGVLAGDLAKILPAVVPLFLALARSISGQLLDALIKLLPPLLQLASAVLTALAAVLPVVVPVMAQLLALFTQAVAGVIGAIATALAAVLNAIPPGVLAGIVIGITAIVGALKLWAIAQAVLDTLLSLNPLGLIVLAVAAVAVAVTMLVQHWNTVYRDVMAPMIHWFTDSLPHGIGVAVNHIHQWWSDVANFFSAGYHAVYDHTLAPFIRFFTETIPRIFRAALAAAQVWWNLMQAGFRQLWHYLWDDFGAKILGFFTKTLPRWWDLAYGFIRDRLITPWRNIFTGIWNWFKNTFGTNILNFFTKTVPSWFDTAVTKIGQFWNRVKSIVSTPISWVINTVLGGMANAFDTITNAIGLHKPIPPPPYVKFARGGIVPQLIAGLGDRQPALLAAGETVVSAAASALPFMQAAFAAAGVPGYARGGRIGQNAPDASAPATGTPGQIPAPGRAFAAAGPAAVVSGPGPFSPGDMLGFVTGAAARALAQLIPGWNAAAGVVSGPDAAKVLNPFANRGTHGAGGNLADIITAIPRIIVRAAENWLKGHAAAGSASAIINYAMQFLGKIPYVWGGTSVPGGADCSGFTQAVYGHFGIAAPRTSEAQGAWVRRGAPTPGGLAFYHSLAGGPDPGHVALIRDAATVISQGGGMGPQLRPLHYMPLLWTGIPPHGFGTAGGPTGGGKMPAAAIAALWTQLGGPAGAAANMAQIAFAESGDDPSAVQKGQPPGLTGWGLYQITPTSGIWQNGAFGNLLNAANNTRAAISLFRASGYGPWASDPVGAALSGGGPRRLFGDGGWINEPVTGVGAYSRQLYSFGEAGREFVTPEAALAAGAGRAAAPLIGSYHTNYYGTGDAAAAMRELAFTLRRAKQGAFYQPGS